MSLFLNSSQKSIIHQRGRSSVNPTALSRCTGFGANSDPCVKSCYVSVTPKNIKKVTWKGREGEVGKEEEEDEDKEKKEEGGGAGEGVRGLTCGDGRRSDDRWCSGWWKGNSRHPVFPLQQV